MFLGHDLQGAITTAIVVIVVLTFGLGALIGWLI